jgi:hypothetical protein
MALRREAGRSSRTFLLAHVVHAIRRPVLMKVAMRRETRVGPPNDAENSALSGSGREPRDVVRVSRGYDRGAELQRGRDDERVDGVFCS